METFQVEYLVKLSLYKDLEQDFFFCFCIKSTHLVSSVVPLYLILQYYSAKGVMHVSMFYH